MGIVTKELPVGVGRMVYNPNPSALRDLAVLDNVPYGGSWNTGGQSNWVDFSDTDGGITFRVTKEENRLTSDQRMNPFLILTTALTVNLATTLRVAVLREIALSSGVGNYTKQDPAAGVKGFRQWKIDGSSIKVKDFCLGFEVETVEGSVWRILLVIAHPTSNIEITTGKGDTAKVPFEAEALEDTGVTPSLTCIVREVVPALPA